MYSYRTPPGRGLGGYPYFSILTIILEKKIRKSAKSSKLITKLGNLKNIKFR
jgi:hypothetical protein